jgi:hypothetical protein
MKDNKYTPELAYAYNGLPTRYVKLLLCLVSSLLWNVDSAHSQAADNTVYRFLNWPVSARMAAMGGFHTAPLETTGLDVIGNPALAGLQQKKAASVSRLALFDELALSTATYSFAYRDMPLVATIRWFSYGSLQRMNEQGEVTGDLAAYEGAFSLAGAKQIAPRWYAGADAGLITARYGDLSSKAAVFSGGFYWRDSTKRSAGGFSMHHAGRALRGFYGERFYLYGRPGDQALPFDVRAGFSHQPEHLPAVLHFTMHSLHRYKLPLPGRANDNASVASHLSRHLTVGIELLLSEQFVVRAGFDKYRNDLHRSDAQFEMAGLSFGFGIKTSRFMLDIARSRFSDAGNTTQLALWYRF